MNQVESKLVMKKSKKILPYLLKKNFFKMNKYILRLREMNPKRLYSTLKKYLPKEIAIKFYYEYVDGQGFIFLLSMELGIQNLETEFHFNDQEIADMKELYLHIYSFRKSYSKDFLSDEIPFYL